MTENIFLFIGLLLLSTAIGGLLVYAIENDHRGSRTDSDEGGHR